jgi:hypothetical protein
MSERRWKLTALLTAGVVIGILMVGTPAGAHIGSVTHLWNHHIKPKADKRYFRYEAKVPPGKTLTGTWALEQEVDATNDVAETAISFALPLSAAPTPIVVPNGGPVPAGCSGTVANPGASPGNVCLFVGWNNGNANPDVGIEGTYDSETGFVPSSKRGLVLFERSDAAGRVEVAGTYAVTAPLSGSSARVVPRSEGGSGP